MKAMVIYDSFFGNTEQIAKAIGNALGAREDVRTVRVSEVTSLQLAGLEMLIVGSPTRGFRPTEGIVSFLNSIPAAGLKGIKVAAFDTRIGLADIKPAIFRFIVDRGGYAAKPIADSLKKAGGGLAAPPEGFFVKDRQGPLKDGELERAAAWARRVSEAR